MVSALYNQGKKKIISMLAKRMTNLSFLSVFKKDDATHDEIAQAGEKLLLGLYGAVADTNTLNMQRYIMYCQQLARKRLSSPEVLPPTSDAAKYHSYRTYLQVQQWLGNAVIIPTYWGWRKDDGQLSPIEMQKLLLKESCDYSAVAANPAV